MVKLSVLYAADTVAGRPVLDVAFSAEGAGVNEAPDDGCGAGAWAGADACRVWGDGRPVGPVRAWADAALSLRLHAPRDRLSTAIKIVATRIPLYRMG